MTTMKNGKKMKTDIRWNGWYKVYLVRGTGYPWREWLNATSWFLAVKTTSHPSNFFPDDRGAILLVPSEIGLYKIVKKIQRVFGDFCRYTLLMGQENPESRNPRPPYSFLVHLLVCHPRNVHQQCVARHCQSVL